MANESKAQPDSIERIRELGYEPRDANASGLLLLACGLLLSVFCIQLALHFVSPEFARRPQEKDWLTGSRREAASVLRSRAFPRLQLSPAQDLKTFRAREDDELHSYGWIDRTSGVVRIPIDRAMDLLLKRGLATRPEGGAARTGPTPLELQQQRNNTVEPETVFPR